MNPTQATQPTITERTFNIVRDNPGMTRKQYVEDLHKEGIKPQSSTSLISQLVRQRMVREENNKLFPNIEKYTTLKKIKPKRKIRIVIPKKQKVVEMQRTVQPKDSAGVNAVNLGELLRERLEKHAEATSGIATLPKTVGFDPYLPTRPSWDPYSIIDSLTVKQAKILRDELNQMFRD